MTRIRRWRNRAWCLFGEYPLTFGGLGVGIALAAFLILYSTHTRNKVDVIGGEVTIIRRQQGAIRKVECLRIDSAQCRRLLTLLLSTAQNVVHPTHAGGTTHRTAPRHRTTSRTPSSPAPPAHGRRPATQSPSSGTTTTQGSSPPPQQQHSSSPPPSTSVTVPSTTVTSKTVGPVTVGPVTTPSVTVTVPHLP